MSLNVFLVISFIVRVVLHPGVIVFDISRNIPVIGSMVLHSRLGHIQLHCCFSQQTSAVKARLLVVRSHSCACISVIENVTNDLLSRAAGHDVVGSVRRRIWRHIRGTCYIPPRARPTAYPGCQRGSIYLSSWHRQGATVDRRSSYAEAPSGHKLGQVSFRRLRWSTLRPTWWVSRHPA